MRVLTFLCGVTAVCMSWAVNHSFWWALFHFIFCGFYIPYWLIVYSPLCKLIQEWIS